LWLGWHRDPVWGLAYAHPEHDGIYTPSYEKGSRLAVIVPVSDGRSIIDLAATCPTTRRTRTRLGVATVLGWRELADARFGEEPAQLWSDPIEWVRQGGVGSVILDWDQAHLELSDLVSIKAQTDELAAKVDHALRLPLMRLPKILVPESYRAAA